MLMDKGYKKVRPLVGGLDGWLAEGRPFESFDPSDDPGSRKIRTPA
jgi:3-mercaptopyruvate sulfurtransferase SseA